MVALFNFLLFTAFHILAAYWSNLVLPRGGKAIFTSCGFILIQFHPSPHEAHPSKNKMVLSVSLTRAHTLLLARPPFVSFILYSV